MRAAAIAVAVAALTIAHPFAQQRPIFRSGRDVVSIDVVVRDREGNVVRGLSQADFEIREDGRPQDVLAFTFQDIAGRGAGAAATVDLLAGAATKMADTARPEAAPREPAGPLTTAAVAGRRLIVLLFDISSMQPEDVQRAVDSARRYVTDQMDEADMVA